MRKLFMSVFIIGLLSIGTVSFAQSKVPVSSEDEINNEAKFLTFRDDKGDEHIIKTIGLVRFNEDGIRFEPGQTISNQETKTTIPPDRTGLER